MLTVPIREVIAATPRARVIRLDLGGRPFDYAAGQAVMVGAHGGVTRKPYSIASAPEDVERFGWIELLIGVDEAGRAGMHLALERDAPVDVEGPLGSFTFPAQPEEQKFVFIAGGTGIAPLRAMLRHALAIPHRDVGLFYSARTPVEFAFEDEFRALADAGQIEFRQTVTRANGADWRGARGRLDRAMLGELVHDPATLCFICGPPALVSEMTALLGEIGVPASRVLVERWTSS
jgi:NAD(P)H-flavin reductase